MADKQKVMEDFKKFTYGKLEVTDIIPFEEMSEDKLRSEGKASVIVSDGEKNVGIIALSDVLRPEAADVALMTDDIARWTDREVKAGKPPHLCTASEVF